MIITICSKFGTNGFCVEVAAGVSEGVGGSVAVAGADVEIGMAEDRGVAVGVEELEQAGSSISRRI